LYNIVHSGFLRVTRCQSKSRKNESQGKEVHLAEFLQNNGDRNWGVIESEKRRGRVRRRASGKRGFMVETS